MSSEEDAGVNYAACPTCEAKPHEPCTGLAVVNAITGRVGTVPLAYVHRNRMMLGGVKPWRFPR